MQSSRYHRSASTTSSSGSSSASEIPEIYNAIPAHAFTYHPNYSTASSTWTTRRIPLSNRNLRRSAALRFVAYAAGAPRYRRGEARELFCYARQLEDWEVATQVSRQSGWTSVWGNGEAIRWAWARGIGYDDAEDSSSSSESESESDSESSSEEEDSSSASEGGSVNGGEKLGTRQAHTFPAEAMRTDAEPTNARQPPVRFAPAPGQGTPPASGFGGGQGGRMMRPPGVTPVPGRTGR